MSRFTSILLSLCLGVLASFAAIRSLAADPVSAPAPPAASTADVETPTAVPATVSSGPGIRELELPVETGIYRPGEGMELAQAFCLTCHSVEYCETQPPSGEKYWSATVKKMKEKFGAPLPDEVIAPLTRYLTAAYGRTTP